MSKQKHQKQQRQQKRKSKLEQRRRQLAKARLSDGRYILNARNSDDPLREEIERAVRRASECIESSVALGGLVLFSTRSGDAWLLEAENQLALCLAELGERLPVAIVDHGDRYDIGYSARFTIDGENFVVAENSGRVRSIVGYPIDAIGSCCRAASGKRSASSSRFGSSPGTTVMQRFPLVGERQSTIAGQIDWHLALEGVPSDDVLEGLNPSEPGDLGECVRILCEMLEEGSFLTWESVIREEQGLALSNLQEVQLNELFSLSDEEDDERTLYVNELARPIEPWYETVWRVVGHLVLPSFRTVHLYFDGQLDGWRQIRDHIKSHAGELSLPPGAKQPIDIIPPDTYHRLELQSCLHPLLGVGYPFNGKRPPTLADPEEHSRVEDLIEELHAHIDSVEFLRLTLDRLGAMVALPAGEFETLKGLIIAQLGPLGDDELLAPRLQVARASAF